MTRSTYDARTRSTVFTALTLFGLTSCSEGQSEPESPMPPRLSTLIDNLGWRRFDAALDPLASHQPAVIICYESATFVEYGSFEVDTNRCNYALLEHPTQRPIAAGAEVQFELLHYDLTAPQPDEAHIALLFGDQLQWETTLPIPRAGDLVKANFRATRALAVGDPIRLHLHNHGGNNYLIVSLEGAVSP